MAEEVRLESVYTPKGYPEFESRSLRSKTLKINQLSRLNSAFFRIRSYPFDPLNLPGIGVFNAPAEVGIFVAVDVVERERALFVGLDLEEAFLDVGFDGPVAADEAHFGELHRNHPVLPDGIKPGECNDILMA